MFTINLVDKLKACVDGDDIFMFIRMAREFSIFELVRWTRRCFNLSDAKLLFTETTREPCGRTIFREEAEGKNRFIREMYHYMLKRYIFFSIGNISGGLYEKKMELIQKRGRNRQLNHILSSKTSE